MASVAFLNWSTLLFYLQTVQQNLPDRSSFSSARSSRRFVIGLVVVAVGLAVLAALSVKMAAQNTDFQEEVQKMRELHDPAFKPPVPADSLNLPADSSRQLMAS